MWLPGTPEGLPTPIWNCICTILRSFFEAFLRLSPDSEVKWLVIEEKALSVLVPYLWITFLAPILESFHLSTTILISWSALLLHLGKYVCTVIFEVQQHVGCVHCKYVHWKGGGRTPLPAASSPLSEGHNMWLKRSGQEERAYPPLPTGSPFELYPTSCFLLSEKSGSETCPGGRLLSGALVWEVLAEKQWVW